MRSAAPDLSEVRYRCPSTVVIDLHIASAICRFENPWATGEMISQLACG